MNINKTNCVYFSPTGTTKDISKRIALKFENFNLAIDITDYKERHIKKSFDYDDFVVFAAPVYGGRIPKTAIERFENISGNNTLAVCIAVYGGREYEDALLELKNTVEKNGFIVIGAGAFVARHSIVNDIAKERPDKLDLDYIDEFSEKIKNKIKDIKNIDDIKNLYVRGNEKYRTYNGVPLKPETNKNCVKCGLCISKCPVNAIIMENKAKTQTDKCISCMRCINICVSNARNISSLKLFAISAKLKKICPKRAENDIFIEMI